MDINGMDIDQISHAMESFVSEYFSGSTLSNTGQCLFAESYPLYYEEVWHLIPGKYGSRFNDEDKFNGTSGIIEVERRDREEKKHEYTVMLLTDEGYENALLLFLLETDETTNEEKTILLKDFLCT